VSLIVVPLKIIFIFNFSHHSSPNIVRVIKSRIGWAGHVARMGEERGVYRVLVGKPEGRRPLGRPRRRWWIILGWISRRWEVGVWT